jgi:hypothetical protein
MGACAIARPGMTSGLFRNAGARGVLSPMPPERMEELLTKGRQAQAAS